MSRPIRAGDFRICGYCGSRNKSAHRYCVRCAAPLDATAAGPPRAAGTTATRSNRLVRFLLAAGVLAALGVGLVVRNVFKTTLDVAAVSDDVRADGARTVNATPAPPPPPVSGWYPGANVPVEPDTAPHWESGSSSRHAETGAPSWSTSSFPAARMNPYDVPGDLSASMVGIAPSSARARAAVNRRRVFTEQDLLATRGGAWAAPPPREDVRERESELRVAESRVQTARARLQQARAQRTRAADVDDGHLQKAIAQAADDLADAEEDMARAQRKRAEERR